MVGWVYDKANELGNKVAEGISLKSGENIADLVWAACGCVIEFKTNLKNLDGDVKRLISAAEDLKIEIALKELGGRKKRKSEVEDWLDKGEGLCQEYKALENEIQENEGVSRFKRARCVRNLSKRVGKHLEERKDIGDLVLDVEKGREKSLPEEIYGARYREILEDIFQCVEAPNNQVIGIYGADKAGKTKLAKQIRNKVLDATSDRVYWVNVSENTSQKMLQDDISNAIGLILDENDDVGIRAMRLHRALKAKTNFVLILDNFRKYIDLKTVGYPVGEDGCRLIITTPSSQVCRQVGGKTIFPVEMTEEEAWNMFKEVYGQDPTPREEYFKAEVNKRCGFPERIIEFARDPEVDDSEVSG